MPNSCNNLEISVDKTKVTKDTKDTLILKHSYTFKTLITFSAKYLNAVSKFKGV
jgi:hypothetical protein